MNVFNSISCKDIQYDKMIQEVREFYDVQIRSGKSVKLTIKANGGKISGFEVIINKQV